ncbi:hypothetical protein AX774_g1130 [Zancudomyces culisetae]|uniref:Uncharacterized protein n=1 Tax=Zancudomyces culisetae TaxID=1213189 RepID=A0A1R1PWK9_ZANCU|nr:hypothetical protein AX774_g1130 [Zancudomyces culisetae]|eukprot:OMH85324.1 hypothetical protein AX774_g1130 [Zancudomyces culisetae]
MCCDIYPPSFLPLPQTTPLVAAYGAAVVPPLLVLCSPRFPSGVPVGLNVHISYPMASFHRLAEIRFQ